MPDYNTWYDRSIELNQETLKQGVKLAGRPGLECRYILAGGYAGSPTKRPSFGL